MIQVAEQQRRIVGVAVAPQAPCISHLLFADDTLVFCGANERQLEEIRRILEGYGRASGQLINFHKSCMVVSGRLDVDEKHLLAAVLGVRLVQNHDKYLGLPSVGAPGILIEEAADFWWGGEAGSLVSMEETLLVFKRGGLGFRDLREFNKALLAKQGTRTSMTWRSILSARELFVEGCRWEDGNEGRWVWRYGTGGRFTVRSVYRRAVKMKERSLASSSGEGMKLLWSSLWRLRSPPRVRLFVWRMCKGAVPTLENLAKRREGIDMDCAVCGVTGESIKHILLECSFTRQVWALSNISWKHLMQWHQGAAEWVLYVFQQVSMEERELFSSLCWAIWKSRCRKVMEGVVGNALQTVDLPRRTMLNYQEVRRIVGA
ncbi:UNVERIFIED_CONTAM: hypothetical protein Slati_1752000 [Sesamum latifolium]|uniref:Reverse transcriptase zinc-binding domain-containing protein n=1 Tax=Sesamum latifolium TaxID=2727402 RepID=A0AAW2WY37_9LAMI